MNAPFSSRNLGGLVLLLAFAVFPCARLSAQDVTVTQPSWFNEANATGDQPPVLKVRSTPKYPTEMRKTEEIGYALVGQSVDPKGKNAFIFQRASHHYFQRTLDWSFQAKMTPAQKGGEPVHSLSWYAVIFNPASAKTKGPDATPRLLAAMPVFVSKQLLSDEKPEEIPALWGKVNLDEKGNPQGVVLELPAAGKFLPSIQESLKNWRFAPARRGGQPVSAEVRIPFFVLESMPANVAQDMVPPRPIKPVDPVYPILMRRAEMRGEVLVEFVVTTTGQVEEAVAIRSTNPAFEEPALEAIRKWKFSPATQGGKPVNARMQQAISFSLDGPRGGQDAYTVTGRSNNKNLPEELRYDTPAKVRGVIIPVYPYELRRDGVRGKAEVRFIVDPTGKVVQVAVIEATHPEFGLALTAAVEQFSFDPAMKDGKPTISVMKFKQEFNSRVLSDDEGTRLLHAEKKRPDSIFSAGDLDQPIKPISRRSPVFPLAQSEVNGGEALVEVIVDDKGYVRLPRVVSASAPEFGYAAVQAINQWRFEPPKVKGKPAMVRVRAPFAFKVSDSP